MSSPVRAAPPDGKLAGDSVRILRHFNVVFLAGKGQVGVGRVGVVMLANTLDKRNGWAWVAATPALDCVWEDIHPLL